MDRTKSYFLYVPPKSNSHGHAVRDKNVKRATQKVIDCFVENFNAITNNEVQLTIYFNNDDELQKAQKTTEELNKFLGLPKREWNNAGFEHAPNYITWETNDKFILETIDYVNQLSEDRFLPLSNYWINCHYHYGQPKVSPSGTIGCSIESGRLFVRLRIIFPYTIDDNQSYDFITKFCTSLPFKLNAKHFKRFGPSKKGYGQWKLDKEIQDRIDDLLKNIR